MASTTVTLRTCPICFAKFSDSSDFRSHLAEENIKALINLTKMVGELNNKLDDFFTEVREIEESKEREERENEKVVILESPEDLKTG